jgi:hypothetical protein
MLPPSSGLKKSQARNQQEEASKQINLLAKS